MKRHHDIVEVQVTLIHETEKAYLFDTGAIGRDGKPVHAWVPKSQCEFDPDTGVVQMPESIAEEKGLI